MRSASGALFSGLLVAFFGSCGQSVPTSDVVPLGSNPTAGINATGKVV